IFSLKCFAIPNHTPVVSWKKRGFFRPLWAGRRCAAASRFTFLSKSKTLYSQFVLGKDPSSLLSMPIPLPHNGHGLRPLSGLC
ncbi:hypothetical protein QUW15_11880, partial [Desulfovibrio piger]|nr:hypothetical protein [Desulfovibrio piger]